MATKKDVSQEADRVSIEWTGKNGTLHAFSMSDVQRAHSLIEHLGRDIRGALEAVRCAAYLYPAIFSCSQVSPLKAVTEWNSKYPPGTEIRCWPAGRTQPCEMTKTFTRAFEIGGLALVVVQGSGDADPRFHQSIALQDCDPVLT